MAQAAAERFGSLDILVNNAALMAEIMGQGTLTTIPMEMWHRSLAVNLTGPLLCTRAVVPYMAEKGYGKIINQSSGGAFLPSAHYGLTKLGLVSMTMSLAKELAPQGIRVNAIAPGWVNTDAGLRTTPPEVRAAIGASIPFPFGDPEDLVGGLVYLASAASDWVTGHTLNIDGGWIPRTLTTVVAPRSELQLARRELASRGPARVERSRTSWRPSFGARSCATSSPPGSISRPRRSWRQPSTCHARRFGKRCASWSRSRSSRSAGAEVAVRWFVARGSSRSVGTWRCCCNFERRHWPTWKRLAR